MPRKPTKQPDPASLIRDAALSGIRLSVEHRHGRLQLVTTAPPTRQARALARRIDAEALAVAARLIAGVDGDADRLLRLREAWQRGLFAP